MKRINLETDFMTTSEFRANVATATETLSDGALVVTQGGKPKFVVMAVGAYEGLVNELELFRGIAQGLDDVLEGRVLAHEEVEKMMKEKFGGASDDAT